MIGKICGTGSSIPNCIVSNDDLSALVDTNDKWIRERTGVRRRHIVREETTVSMASEAAKRALEQGEIAPEEVDLILVSTISSEVLLPCTACEVQKEIGAVNAWAFDLNAACTGFLFAFHTAQAYIEAGMSRVALVIGAESLSNLVNWQDRSTWHPIRGRRRRGCPKSAGRTEIRRCITFRRMERRRPYMPQLFRKESFPGELASFYTDGWATGI